MAAVIPSTQLSANMVPAGASAPADAAAMDASGQAATPPFFAALLAQQLGIGVQGGLGKTGEVIDAEADSGADATDATLLAAADADIVDTLAQLQQGIMGLPVPPASNAAPVETPAEELSALTTPRRTVGLERGLAVAESVATERQAVAANPAAFAETESQAMFTVPAEALAEQAARPQAIGAQQSAATPPVTGAIAQPLSSPAWGDVLGDRVMWMVGQQQQGAELRLNPPSLGPLEIKLSMSDGQANLTFSTQHLPVKEALEAATPRLREMFGESGLNLGSVSVNVGSFSQQQAEQQQANRQAPREEWGQAQAETEFTAMLPTAVTSLGRNGNGMVDFFA